MSQVLFGVLESLKTVQTSVPTIMQTASKVTFPGTLKTRGLAPHLTELWLGRYGQGS